MLDRFWILLRLFYKVLQPDSCNGLVVLVLDKPDDCFFILRELFFKRGPVV